MRELIACLDIGTTNLKLTVLNQNGDVVSLQTKPTRLTGQRPGQVELDPAELLDQVKPLIRDTEEFLLEPLSALTVTGMANSELPLDEAGRPLGPIKCWLDRRNEQMFDPDFVASCRQLYQQIPTYRYLPYTLQWYRTYRPELYARAHVWVEAVDFVVGTLAGVKAPVMDYSHAARTLLYDSRRECWNEELAGKYQVDLDKLPKVAASGTVLGTLRPEFSGYRDLTRVVLGGHDHACAVFSSCVGTDGLPLNSTGTSEGIAFPLEPNRPLPLLALGGSLAHQIPRGRVCLVNYMSSSGDIMKWADRLFQLFRFERTGRVWEEYLKRGGELPCFLPDGRGGRIDRRGLFGQLSAGQKAEDMCLSVLEGLAFDFAGIMQRVTPALGYAPAGLRCVGGLSKLDHYLKLKATITGLPIYAYPKTDFVALGGYLICMAALHPDWDMDECAQRQLERERYVQIEPQEHARPLMEERFARYKQLCASLDGPLS